MSGRIADGISALETSTASTTFVSRIFTISDNSIKVTGSLVRTIRVGHKPVGYYLTRERAVYWDGRNENRESVSSGVYFYTLNTDTYTQTRRMVIVK